MLTKYALYWTRCSPKYHISIWNNIQNKITFWKIVTNSLRVNQHRPTFIWLIAWWHCNSQQLIWKWTTNRWSIPLFVRRAGLLWSQQDFEWRWSVPLFKCFTVLEFSFILFDLCLLITFFNFIMNYVPIVTFWIFTYHKIWILSIMFCSIWSYWIIYFLACLEVSWRVVS